MSRTLPSLSSVAPLQFSPCQLAPERDSLPAGRAHGLVAAVSSAPPPTPPAVSQGRMNHKCEHVLKTVNSQQILSATTAITTVNALPYTCHGLLQESPRTRLIPTHVNLPKLHSIFIVSCNSTIKTVN